MPKIRKRPTPADPDAQVPAAPLPAAEPAAPAAPVANVPDQELVPQQTALQRVPPIDMPASAEQMMHNVMVRQLEDDAAEAARPQDRQDPALALLARLQDRKDTGESMKGLQEDIARVTQGLDVEDKLTSLAYRSHRNRKLRRWLEADDNLDRFLLRCFNRGDLTPTEALILKRLSTTEITSMAKELMEAVRENVTLDPSEVLKMDYTLQMTERDVGKQFSSTTPQGREIIRKITVKARRALFPQKPQPAK